MAKLNVGKFRPDFLDHRPPQARRGEDVGLVDAGQLAAPGPGELEREADDTADLLLRVRQRVTGGALARIAGRFLARSEVHAASQLTDDEEVDAGEEIGAKRRCRNERRVNGYRSQIGEQPQPAAQREQGLLRSDLRVRVVPAGATDRAEEDGIGAATDLDVLGPDRDTERVDGRPAGRDFGPVGREPEPLADRVEHRASCSKDLRPDSVTGNGHEAIGRAPHESLPLSWSCRPLSEVGGRGPRCHPPEDSSTTRGLTNPADTPLISAPWSLLTATR